jgi:transcription initiation factor TFIIIB Brf1 subunit/transcription initiation factor TFIIB
MANNKKDFSNGYLKCQRCGETIGRKIYDNQILELDGVLIHNWIRGECNKVLPSGRSCSQPFEWVAPMLERSKNEIAPDTLRDILSAARAHRTDNSKRIKTLQLAT